MLNCQIVLDAFGEYKALMNERVIVDRWVYLMDETGQHEIKHESQAYGLVYLGNVYCQDANVLLELLRELNQDLNAIQQAKTYIWAFNNLRTLIN